MNAEPLMLQDGSALTVKTMSSWMKVLPVQLPLSDTVRRRVAEAGAPLMWTVRGKDVQFAPQEVGGSMVTAPPLDDTRLHAKPVIGLLPDCAVPVRLNVVVPLGSTHL